MKYFYLILLLVISSACTKSTSDRETHDQTDQKESAEKHEADDKPGEGIVYATRDGDKYHTADCRYSKTAHAVSIKQAKADGKTACDLCRPSSITGEKQIRCTGTTMEGKQCARMTTNANGKCYQHQDG